MKNYINILLEDVNVSADIRLQEEYYLFSQLKVPTNLFETPQDTSKLLRIISILITYTLVDTFSVENSTENLLLLKKTYNLLSSINIDAPNCREEFQDILGIEGIEPNVLYYFYMCCLALKANDTIKIRVDLEKYTPLSKSNIEADWKYNVQNKVIEALLLLTRKAKGFSDIQKAFQNIIDLRNTQKVFEDNYLTQKTQDMQLNCALSLLGLYHISKIVIETADYLLLGYAYKQNLDSLINQHGNLAKEALKGEPRLQSLVSLIMLNLKLLRKNSIWANTNFNDKVKKLCEWKAQSDYGIIDLLPSQQDALGKNLLNITSNVTVLQMPTSAGKTLLAEFTILVTKSLKPSDKIIYLVPSRALVNQVYYDLKADFDCFPDFVIEKTSSAIEIDNAEWELLESDSIDVLISTPEKLDLLIKRNHPSVDNISLIIVDEAHSIANGERGAKLELLLSVLKRERSDAKFLLLSPFLGQNGQKNITDWLAGERIKTEPIKIDWRPAEKLVVGVKVEKKKAFSIYMLKSPYSTLLNEISRKIVPNYTIEASSEKAKIREFAIKNWAKENKTMLFLCAGKTSADNLAAEIAKLSQNKAVADEELLLVKKFIEDEVGTSTTLSNVLEKQIAVHHAGLSDEVKLLIEHLIRKRKIKYVCATNTIGEGVNFPVSSVFFDSFEKGDTPISTNDFWNIAGRAGRTLIDNFGTIIFPFSGNNEEKGRALIQEASNELASVLVSFIADAGRISHAFREQAQPFQDATIQQYEASLNPLIQYIVHLLTVTDRYGYVNQIEDLFKESLGYFMLNPDQKISFIEVCQSIYDFLQKKQKKNILSFADKTGFSVPSVLKVMYEKQHNPYIKDLSSWETETLFDINNPTSLTEKIKVIAALKETKLGTESSQPFNEELIAKILIKWVKGDKLANIVAMHPYFATMDDSKKMNEFVKKVNDMRFKASWGLSALEGIVRGKEDEAIKDSFVPSYVYFGVDNEKSLLLRMVGIPRILSFSMASIIEKESKNYNYNSVRKIISNLSNNEWDNLIPKNSNLSGLEWKKITEILIK